MNGYVYRAFDADDRLIYIGATVYTDHRLTIHRTQSWWWALVARVAFEQHVDREAALAAEAAAIRAERPAFNLIDQPGGVQAVRYVPRLTEADLQVCRDWRQAFPHRHLAATFRRLLDAAPALRAA